MSWCHCFPDPDYHYVQPGNLIGFWSYYQMISNYCCLHWCLSPRGFRSSLCFTGSYIADIITRVHAPVIVIFSTPSKINKIIKLVRIKSVSRTRLAIQIGASLTRQPCFSCFLLYLLVLSSRQNFSPGFENNKNL